MSVDVRGTCVRIIALVLIVSVVAIGNAQDRRRFPGNRRPDARPLTQEEKKKAVEAIDRLIEQVKTDKTIGPDKIDGAISTISAAARALPPDELLAKLYLLQKHRTDSAIPTPRKRLSRDNRLDCHILSTQIRALQNAPPEKVKAHPCAEAFPGAVPDGAKRVSRKIEVKTDAPGWHNYGIYGNPGSPYWHSTGLYAAPGEVVTVAADKSVIDKGLSVRIGCHSDRLWRNRSWARAPDVCVRAPITAEQTKVASAFGGLIYVESPPDLKLPPFSVTVSGAVEAPYYVHGKTDLKQWRTSIRNDPAPWAELQGRKIILSLPAADVRKLDDPKELMDFWDGIMDLYAELFGRPAERRRIERFVADVQISAGYMHSGYPLMAMLDITSTMVYKPRIEANRHHGIWGLFHEIGHNHQNRDWTYRGTTEVTVNLFSLYVMEKVCKLPTGGHGCVTKGWRERRIKQYFAEGAKFDQWKADPFLALAMYIQLQHEFGWKPFTQVFAEYRELPDEKRPKTDDQKRDRWLVSFSKTAGRNLGPFFQAWGVPTSDAARASIADLPKWMPKDMPAGQKK